MQETLAIPGSEVLEVVPAITPSPVAGCCSPWQGVICYRGEIVPVMDLCERYNIPATRPTMRQRILIMRPHQTKLVALKVPSVSAMSESELHAAQASRLKGMIRQLPTCEIFAEPYYRIAETMLEGIRS